MLPRARALGAGVVLTLAASWPAAGATHAGRASTYAVHAVQAVRAKASDPRRTRGLFVDPTTTAARAAKSHEVFAPLGNAAQARWITDASPTDQVRAAVAAYTKDANDADRTPVLSVYAIPDRDCGLHSAGGLPGSEEYKSWIREVAAGMQDQHAMVVLEPDAVPFMGDPRCHNADDRATLLRFATKALTNAGAWVYLDAGHSGWRRPADIAPLLKASGIALARGFSTNVGNYRRSPDEVAYAKAVLAQLKKLGVTGKRYVTETARNGAARDEIVDGDVCNPTWARIGRTPRLLFEHGPTYGPLDGYLWVKHPGESDGQSADDSCHGGPAPGEWWPRGARRLLGLR